MSNRATCCFCLGEISGTAIQVTGRDIGRVKLGDLYIHGSCFLEKIDPRFLRDDVDIGNDHGSRLTTQGLTELIVDALLRPGLIREADVETVLAIVAEEINALKAFGDF